MIEIILILFSIYLIWKVSSSFDLAANYLTRNMGEGIKGPTVNAVASSLPELMISSLFLFFYKDINGFSAGFATIIGSSAFNIAIIPVIAYIFALKKNQIQAFKVDKKIVFQDGIFLLISIILLGLGFIIGLNIYYALILLSTYLFYILFIYKKRRVNHNKINDKIGHINTKFENGLKWPYLKSIINLRIYNIYGFKKINSFNSTIVIITSVLIISLACYSLVEVVENISESYGVNLFITAFFIAAISSSVPDTILSIKDAENNQFNDSFSNTYGSNIFDICVGIGLPIFIYSLFNEPISIDTSVERLGLTNFGDKLFDGNLLVWSTVVLFVFTLLLSLIYLSEKINKKNIPYILVLYFLYIIALILF